MSFSFHPFQYGQVSVTAAATLIFAANTATAGVLIVNSSASTTVYIGDSGVTSSTGFPLAGGASVTLPSTASVYGITSSSSATVGFLQVE